MGEVCQQSVANQKNSQSSASVKVFFARIKFTHTKFFDNRWRQLTPGHDGSSKHFDTYVIGHVCQTKNLLSATTQCKSKGWEPPPPCTGEVC